MSEQPPLSRPFSKLLVANRGEIAVRVLRSARALGYPCVAVFSTADAGAPHVGLADEAVEIGPPPARASYLDSERILDAARRTGADAIHPGYGFLAENADFAARCAEAGVVFVGPPPEAIRVMGDKARARQRMERAGVPCVPGYDGAAKRDDSLVEAARAVGFPLLVKAAAGGGGRGMRRVLAPGELLPAVQAARQEAQAAFGNGGLLLERLIEGARHVEIQVLADACGRCVHLGERDCSTQRRYQKVIEEAPSPAVDAALRERMGAAAVAAAQEVGYVGAGTVEFLLGQDGEFYFLEMNTRLQVEHPVTELVCGGLDLVALQLAVASGRPLPLRQEDVTLVGHAIEVRLYAEDPYEDHRPHTGRVLAWEPSATARCDHGLRPGQEISAFYDPMIGKLIAYGADRDEARRRLRLALADTVLLGVRSNKRFLGAVLDHPTFAAGEVTTGFLSSPAAAALHEAPTAPDWAWAAGALFWVERLGADAGWRNTAAEPFPIELTDGDSSRMLQLRPGEKGAWQATPTDERTLEVREISRDGARVRVDVDGIQRTVFAAWGGGTLHLEAGGVTLALSEVLPRGAEASAKGGDGSLLAPHTGSVVAVDVAPGDVVEAGQRVAALEAMKIQSPLTTAVAGTVAEVRIAVGDQVSTGQLLIVITPEEDASQ